MVNFMNSSDDLVVAVSLIRETFGPVEVSALGLLLKEHFPELHGEWRDEKEAMDRAADTALAEWRAHALRRSLIATFARPKG